MKNLLFSSDKLGENWGISLAAKASILLRSSFCAFRDCYFILFAQSITLSQIINTVTCTFKTYLLLFGRHIKLFVKCNSMQLSIHSNKHSLSNNHVILSITFLNRNSCLPQGLGGWVIMISANRLCPGVLHASDSWACFSCGLL